MQDITVDQWKEKFKEDSNALILDVRTQDEVDEGMIDGAQHIDIFLGRGFIDEVEKLDKSKNYYIYCRSGGRSAQACQIMNQLGFKTTYNLVGGFTAWDALNQ